jgi:hypothetical protein
MTDDVVARVKMLKDAPPGTFVIVLSASGVPGESVIGPFSEDECREELARREVPPAAIEARIARARRDAPL